MPDAGVRPSGEGGKAESLITAFSVVVQLAHGMARYF
jgi:hypothetical protein